jgi:flagellar export protein FliJ
LDKKLKKNHWYLGIQKDLNPTCAQPNDLPSGGNRMSDVLGVIHRIRKAKEDEERQKLAQAQQAREVSKTILLRTTEALEYVQNSEDGADAGMMAQRHAYALRLEMNRRALAHEVELRDAIVEDRRGKLRSAALDAKAIENVTEARHERIERERAKKHQGQLDEFGSMGWWRDSA